MVLPIHFEDRSGTEFERLAFAYIMRDGEWKTIDWYGRLGGDKGKEDCPVMMVERRATWEMDRLRARILSEFGSVFPGLRVHLPL